MLKANFTNYSRYNFSMTLEDTLKRNRDQGQHIANYEILKDVLIDTINTIEFLGNDDISEKLQKKFKHLVEYFAMNYHKSSEYYQVFKKSQGIELCIKLLEVVKNQNAKRDCLHGCCK